MNTVLDLKVSDTLQANGLQYETLQCDPDLADTTAFCLEYGFSHDQSANTLLVASRKIDPTKYAVCVVLATTKLDVNKTVCKLLGIKRASFASAEETKELTGMMIGGVTAIGITNLPIYIDAHVLQQPKVVMGGGNRSSKIFLDPHELLKLPNAEVIEGLAKPSV